MNVEQHVGESVAAKMRRQPLIIALLIGTQVQRRDHAIHRVDHAAELRDEENIHHACGREFERQRRPHRDGQGVNGRNPLVRIDEEPFPIERNDLDPHRASRSLDTSRRVELVRTDPCDAAEQDDRERRDRPDHQFDAARIGPIGTVDGAGI